MQNFGAQIWTEFISPKLTCEERICEKRFYSRQFSTAPSWPMPFLYPPKRREQIFRQLTCALWTFLTVRLKTLCFRTREFPEHRCMQSICGTPNCFERTCHERTCETHNLSTRSCHLQTSRKRICPRPNLGKRISPARFLRAQFCSTRISRKRICAELFSPA